MVNKLIQEHPTLFWEAKPKKIYLEDIKRADGWTIDYYYKNNKFSHKDTKYEQSIYIEI